MSGVAIIVTTKYLVVRYNCRSTIKFDHLSLPFMRPIHLLEMYTILFSILEVFQKSPDVIITSKV